MSATAPVVNALRRRVPDLRVTLRTTVSRDLLTARFDPPWDLVPTAADFGMCMTSALDVDVEDSARAYARLHEHWPERVAEEAVALTALAPDVILSNIPYLTLGLPFIDVVRSCDAVIGKPGYGTFTEAACNGTPMVYVQRGDWPEEPYLIEWLHQNGRAVEVDRAALERGNLGDALAALWRIPKKNPVTPTGIEEAADIVAPLLK